MALKESKEPIIAREEWPLIGIVILILAFLFSFRWEGAATFDAWLANFIPVLAIVALSVFVHEASHRWLADKYFARVRSKIWLSGVIAALVLVILSGGYIVLAAIWAITITPIYFLRPGKPAKKEHLGPYELAKIALIGNAANFLLIIFARLFSSVLGEVLTKQIININLSIALFNLFPFFTVIPVLAWRAIPLRKISSATTKGVPYIEGEYVFFGSRLLWVFTYVFILTSGLLLYFQKSIWLALFVAFALAFGLWLAWETFLGSNKPYGLRERASSGRAYPVPEKPHGL